MSTNGCGFFYALQVGLQLGMTRDCGDATSYLLASLSHFSHTLKHSCDAKSVGCACKALALVLTSEWGTYCLCGV